MVYKRWDINHFHHKKLWSFILKLIATVFLPDICLRLNIGRYLTSAHSQYQSLYMVVMAGKNKEWVHTQRCCNPLKLDVHTGTNIRKISKNILLLFPTLSPLARICNSCQKAIYAEQNNSSCGNNNTNAADVVDCIEHEEDGGMGLADDLNEPEAKKSRHTKEVAFDNLLIGLKVKFKSLPKNDPMCKSILTILPDSWTIKDICEEFGCSYRMARDSKCLKQ